MLKVAYQTGNLPHLSGNFKIRFFNPGKEMLRRWGKNIKKFIYAQNRFIWIKDLQEIAIFREDDTLTTWFLYLASPAKNCKNFRLHTLILIKHFSAKIVIFIVDVHWFNLSVILREAVFLENIILVRVFIVAIYIILGNLR